MSSYPGSKELQEYIEVDPSASFNYFVARYATNLTEWSTDLSHVGAHKLHSTWFNRFQRLHEQIHGDSTGLKKPKFDHLFWGQLLNQIKRQKQLQLVYEEGAIDVLPEAIDLVNTDSQTMNDSNTTADFDDLAHPSADDDLIATGDAYAATDASTSITSSATASASNTASESSTSSTPKLSTKSDGSTAMPTSPLSLSLQAPLGAPFIVDGVNVSDRFYRLQQYVFDFVKTNSLTLESDTHLILSLSSILLLQNNNRLHPAMVPFFGNKLYNKIRRQNLGDWNMAYKFPGDLMLKAISIVEDVYDNGTDRINACASLLHLANTTNDAIDKRLLVSVSQLVQRLPLDTTNTELSEMTLITRYLSPALQPLFDDQERNVRLEFTSSDFTCNQNQSPTFNGCPNCIITIFQHESDDGTNLGYGEVKRTLMAGNHYLVNWDLMRLAVFGKNTIDSTKVSGNLAIHVVGPFVTFYLIKLHADGLYIMTELARLQIPMSILEVPAYLTNFGRLKNVIHTFENHCTLDDNNDDLSSWHRDSYLATDFMFVCDKKKDRKRKDTTGHYASK